MLKLLKRFHFILLLLFCFFIFSGCQSNIVVFTYLKNSSDDNQNLKAFQVIDTLKTSKLPISKIEYFTSETDLEKLLGKPEQYVEKASWIDTRIKTNSDDNFVGGGIEVFKSKELLWKRKSHWLAKESMFGFQNHYFENKNVLMILDGSLSQKQIAAYEKAFKSL